MRCTAFAALLRIAVSPSHPKVGHTSTQRIVGISASHWRAYTLGEFGVVLMVGGNIPGETRTIAIAIYDQVQAFDTKGAGRMASVLLAISFATLLSTSWLNNKSVSRT